MMEDCTRKDVVFFIFSFKTSAAAGVFSFLGPAGRWVCRCLKKTMSRLVRHPFSSHVTAVPWMVAMTPDKDPQSYSLLAYLAFGGLSVWGGLVAYIQTIRRDGRPFAWREAAAQVAVSGFAGMLTMLLSWYMHVPIPLCGFMSGLAGLMGSKALAIYEQRAASWRGEGGKNG